MSCYNYSVTKRSLDKTSYGTGAYPGIFSGRGVFLESGHLDKHSPSAQERKAPQITDLFPWKLLKIAFLMRHFTYTSPQSGHFSPN